MSQTLLKQLETTPEARSSIAEITGSMSRRLMLVTAGTYVVCFYAYIARWPEKLSWQGCFVTMAFVGASGLSLIFLRKNISMGLTTWLMGMALTITLGLLQFHHVEIAFLYALLPLLAFITIGWLAGLLVEVLVIGLTFGLAYSSLSYNVPAGYVSSIIALALFTGLVGWVVKDTLISSMQWYLFSFEQSERNLESARNHRAEVLKVQKSLDIAYKRLQKLNSELVAAWQAASEAEHFKTQLVTTVSHELRTPLNLIIGFTEMMRTSPESYDSVPLPGPYRTDVNAIYHSAQHLLALVDDVIDLARIESGRIALTRDRVDVNALVSETTDMFSDFLAAKGLDLRVHIAPDLPPLWVDRVRIRQVLLNLLTNAVRFTEQGYIAVIVELQGDETSFKVTDTGRGIRDQDLITVFDEFSHSDTTDSAWHSGSGLGLPISKRFVELHGGQMGVESTYSKGSTFWFTLPCLPQLPNRQWTRPANPSAQRVTQPSPTQSITLVHDDPQCVHLLERYLDGFRVSYTDDIEEGMALARNSNGILMVTDPAMIPSMLPENIPIVSCPLPSGPQAAASLGANNLLVKPVSSQDILEAIDRLNRPVQRILIADDEPEAIRLFQRMLSTRVPKQNCLAAHTSEEALSLIEQEKPDLVLLDMVLPKAGGLWVLESMARNPDLAKIAVIIVSAMAEDHLPSTLSGSVQFIRSGGYRLGETMQILEATLGVLGSRYPFFAPKGQAPAIAPAD